jgi:hypothetical protein
LLKIIKLLNLTETTGTYSVRGSGLKIFERAYQDGRSWFAHKYQKEN